MKIIIFILLAMIYTIPSFSQTMEWYIRDNYVDIKYMGNDLFKVQNTKGKWGVINEYGEITVGIQYDSITPIVENRALLLDNTGQFLKGIIDEKGQIIKSFHNNEILANFQHFKEGMLAYGVAAEKYYLFGYLDINGSTRIFPQYYWAAPFNNGKAVIQYQSKKFGLIDKNGDIALNENRNLNFISTPVDNKLLVVVKTLKGEKVKLAKITSKENKLSDIEDLEVNTIVKRSTDYKSISCNNGHSYYFDNALRLISSSTGTTFNETLIYDKTLPSAPNFKKIHGQEGWKILYFSDTLFHSSFRDISFCGSKYAIVTSQRNKMGVLKLNNNGNIALQNIPNQVEFYHNATVKSNLVININSLFSSSQVQIGVIGLKNNNQEEMFKIPTGYNGIYNQPISFFIPAAKFDSEVSLPIKVNLYIDEMLYKTETKELTGVHKRAFSISEANAPAFSDPDGNATINFDVQSLEFTPSSSAKVIVSGDFNQSKRFDGNDFLSFKIPVTIPIETTKTFSFTVTVKEDGCPTYTKTIKRTIKHYDFK